MGSQNSNEKTGKIQKQKACSLVNNIEPMFIS